MGLRHTAVARQSRGGVRMRLPEPPHASYAPQPPPPAEEGGDSDGRKDILQQRCMGVLFLAYAIRLFLSGSPLFLCAILLAWIYGAAGPSCYVQVGATGSSLQPSLFGWLPRCPGRSCLPAMRPAWPRHPAGTLCRLLPCMLHPNRLPLAAALTHRPAAMLPCAAGVGLRALHLELGAWILELGAWSLANTSWVNPAASRLWLRASSRPARPRPGAHAFRLSDVTPLAPASFLNTAALHSSLVLLPCIPALHTSLSL